MRRHLKKISLMAMPLFFVGTMFACTPGQVNTANNVMQQADFYVGMAEALVQVAALQYEANPPVQTALRATLVSLGVVKKAMVAAQAGLSKDQAALKAAVVMLVIEVFALAKAIKDAQATNASSAS